MDRKNNEPLGEKMNRIWMAFIFAAGMLFMVGTAQAVCGGAAVEYPAGIWTTSDASRDCVDDAIQNYATVGETVVVKGGDAVWSTPIVITKGMTFVGGTGTITANGTLADFVIQYRPVNPSLNERFEMKNFTITGSYILMAANSSYIHPLTKIIIHDNHFTQTGRTYIFRTYRGPCYGVMYDNTFTGAEYGEFFDIMGGDSDSWNNLTSEYGTENNFYIEDNAFILTDLVVYGGRGGRYVFRYNTVNLTTGETEYVADMHGDGGSYGCGTMVTEIYGNKIEHDASTGFWDQRGGWLMGYFNEATNGAFIKVRDDFYGQLPDPCPHPGNPQPNYPANSYYWNNRDREGLITSFAVYNVMENVNFWTQRTGAFNGTGDSAAGGGVGCGPLVNRPATCVPGVAYWATDQGNCSDLTGYVGNKMTNPERGTISGTLYKCTAPNVWTAYYRPYIYPHPLRGFSITVTSPAGGTIWIQDTDRIIAWNASGVTETVRIELLKGGVLNRVIAQDQPVANGSYVWTVPADQTTGNDYSVRLAAGAHESTSGTFSIVAAGAPVVTTNPATGMTQTAAVLRGTVHPMGYQTAYRFEYGLTAAYGSTTPVVNLSAGADATAVQVALTGLTPATTYHFRLVAENGAGAIASVDRTFTTASSGGGGGGGAGEGGGGGGCFIVAVSHGFSPPLILSLVWFLFSFLSFRNRRVQRWAICE